MFSMPSLQQTWQKFVEKVQARVEAMISKPTLLQVGDRVPLDLPLFEVPNQESFTLGVSYFLSLIH